MIRRVLVANRGEIAVRIFRTLREMNIETVAVHTDTDQDSVHTRSADRSYQTNNYLDIENLLEIAQISETDAIHPGYGFLAENPIAAQAVLDAGLTFIGPTPDTIRIMGDKLRSKSLMSESGLPVIPSWDSPPAESEFPVLIKAVGGGGGKGMRIVHSISELESSIEAAAREAEKAFGDSRVFIEKYIDRPRHIEIQVLGDLHNNFVHLFERECSIQRRYQKIVEETPSPGLDIDKRDAMGAAAIKAARAVNYLGVGTVEFVLDPSDNFYFLEMNTRLQVEHPLTEWTTGTDLVREQIQIANGDRLSFDQESLSQTGHSLECRIYAEEPEESFRPSVGTIGIYRPPDGPGIRLDSGVEEGSVVSFEYDPLLAKLSVWAPNREAAIARMRRALGDFVILGVRTNIDFLKRVILSKDFARGMTDTHFLERHQDLLKPSNDQVPLEALIAASLANHTPTSRPSNARTESLQDVWQIGQSWRNS